MNSLLVTIVCLPVTNQNFVKPCLTKITKVINFYQNLWLNWVEITRLVKLITFPMLISIKIVKLNRTDDLVLLFFVIFLVVNNSSYLFWKSVWFLIFRNSFTRFNCHVVWQEQHDFSSDPILTHFVFLFCRNKRTTK